MFNDKIFLTPKEILEHEFKIDARGYRPQEVDKFLDMVIRDYTEFLTIIKNYEIDLHDLNEDNQKLKTELRSIRTEIAANSDKETATNINNIDLLKRISQLEKVVFGKNE